MTTQTTIELNQKQIHKMVAGLRCALGIQEGVELVYLLGDGSEENNSQAIGSWIEKQLPTIAQADRDTLFDRLKSRLAQNLSIGELH